MNSDFKQMKQDQVAITLNQPLQEQQVQKKKQTDGVVKKKMSDCAKATWGVRLTTLAGIGMLGYYLGKMSGACEQLEPMGHQLEDNTAQLDQLGKEIEIGVAGLGGLMLKMIAVCTNRTH